MTNFFKCTKKINFRQKKGCQGSHISKTAPGNFTKNTSNSCIMVPWSCGIDKSHWNQSDPKKELCWVELTLILVVPLSALFGYGRYEFGRNGCVVWQEGGTSQI